MFFRLVAITACLGLAGSRAVAERNGGGVCPPAGSAAVWQVPSPAAVPPDSLHIAEIPPARRDLSLWQKFKAYLDQTNKPKPPRQTDFSLIGGPFYSTNTRFGVGLVGSALYHVSGDSLSRPSNFALKAQISTSLFYSVGLSSATYFSHDRFRFFYDLKFMNLPTKFWGIGWDNDRFDDHYTKIKKRSFSFNGAFMWRFAPELYIGPRLDLGYTMAGDIRNRDIWGDLPVTVTTIGIGLTLQLDSRDNDTYPTRGFHVAFDQMFYPEGMGNTGHGFSLTEISAAHYVGLWRNSVVATRLQGRFTYGNTPWNMMGTFGGASTMRGYYEGRYCDKNAVDITVELRQHLAGRSGFVLWGGAGVIFPDFGAIRWRRVLPNVGTGYRWEFKKHVNVRVDVGFGRGEWGVEFNINEAF